MTGAEVFGAGTAVAVAGILGFAFGAVAAGVATERRRVMGAPSMLPAEQIPPRVWEVVQAARAVIATWDDYETCKVAKERLAKALGQ